MILCSGVLLRQPADSPSPASLSLRLRLSTSYGVHTQQAQQVLASAHGISACDYSKVKLGHCLLENSMWAWTTHACSAGIGMANLVCVLTCAAKML